MSNIIIAPPDIQAALDNPVIGVIVGCYADVTQHGIQAYAIDARDGETMASHFCSNEDWAKSDLGINMSRDHNSNDRHEAYSHKYPDGYVTFWIGGIHHTHFGEQVAEKRFFFENTRFLRQIVEKAKNSSGSLDEIAKELALTYKAASLDMMNDESTYEQRAKTGCYKPREATV